MGQITHALDVALDPRSHFYAPPGSMHDATDPRPFRPAPGSVQIAANPRRVFYREACEPFATELGVLWADNADGTAVVSYLRGANPIFDTHAACIPGGYGCYWELAQPDVATDGPDLLPDAVR